jgi:uncharacterized tellurite resistance protein B-like protein
MWREVGMGEAEDPDLVGVGKAERKAFLRVLSSLAWADGEATRSELEVVHLAASDLQVSISERDLEPRDLEALAGAIQRPALQERLLFALKRLAEADDRLAPEELATIKYLAGRWGCAPPAIVGVEWDRVVLPPDGPDGG